MKKSIYDRYFQSLEFYTKNGKPEENVVVSTIENLDGFVKLEFILKNREIKDLSEPIITFYLDWSASDPVKLGNSYSPLNVENVKVNGKDEVRIEYKRDCTCLYLKKIQNSDSLVISMESVAAIIPISESVPFNRYILHLNFRINKKLNDGFLFKIIRNESYSTRFTKGNFNLAFPARLGNNSRKTNIYYRKNEEGHYYLKMGLVDASKNKLLSEAYSLLKAALMIFMLYIILSISDQVILQVLGGCLFVGVPMMDYLPDLLGYNRFKYYIGKSDITIIPLLLICICIVPSFVLFVLYLNGTVEKVWLLLVFAVILAASSVIMFLLDSIGLLQRYVCDFGLCKRQLKFRIWSYNCYSTGRVVCKRCMRKYCSKCAYFQEKHPLPNYIPPCIKL